MIGLFTKYELYTFTYGDTKLHYTSGAKFITHNDIVYEPMTMDRDNIESSAAMEKNSVGIRFPMNTEFPQNQLRSVLEQPVIVEIFEFKGGVKSFLWRGRLIGVTPDEAEIELNFQSEYTELQALGNQMLFQRTCPYALYQAGCNADRTQFRVRTTVSAINGLFVTVRGTYTDGLYNLGIIQSEVGDYIGIEKQTNGNLTLFNRYNFQVTSQSELDDLASLETTYQNSITAYNDAVDYLNTLDPSDPLYPAAQQDVADKQAAMNQAQSDYDAAYEAIAWVYIYLGCNKTIDDCVNKFDNINNFGGFPYTPINNPTSRSVV